MSRLWFVFFAFGHLFFVGLVDKSLYNAAGECGLCVEYYKHVMIVFALN